MKKLKQWLRRLGYEMGLLEVPWWNRDWDEAWSAGGIDGIPQWIMLEMLKNRADFSRGKVYTVRKEW